MASPGLWQCATTNDVGVKCKAEVKKLSEISAYRPGDLLSGLIDMPLEFDAGGTEKHAVDTTVTYTSGSARSLSRSLRGEQQSPANRAEKEKINKTNKEFEQGMRTGLPPGYRFIPAGITSRGVTGERFEPRVCICIDVYIHNAHTRPNEPQLINENRTDVERKIHNHPKLVAVV